MNFNPTHFFLLAIAVYFFLPANISAQTDSLEAKYLEEYNRRIKLDYINGQYIPLHLGEAHLTLNRLISKESKTKFKHMAEEQAVRKLFFSFGRWIRVKWGLYEGSRLSHHLKQLDIHHPDDMSEFIIVTYHRKLNKKPFEAKELINRLKKERRKEYLKRVRIDTIPISQ